MLGSRSTPISGGKHHGQGGRWTAAAPVVTSAVPRKRGPIPAAVLTQRKPRSAMGKAFLRHRRSLWRGKVCSQGMRGCQKTSVGSPRFPQGRRAPFLPCAACAWH